MIDLCLSLACFADRQTGYSAKSAPEWYN